MSSHMKPMIEAREALHNLPVYNSGISIAQAREISGQSDIAALASNENPYGTSPAVRQALDSLVPSRYSQSTSGTLRQTLAEKLKTDSERVLCGNGSEELIGAICRTYIRQGDEVLTVVPCFGLHQIEAIAAGATVKKIPMTKAMDYDIDGLVNALHQRPRIFFISSPSNPVGKALTKTDLDRLLDATSAKTLFVLDEAYFEFIDADYPNGLDFLSQRPDLPWITLRTFSKAYGLAGLRIGYGIASHPQIVKAVQNCLSPFNVNSAAQIAASAALKDEKWMQATADIICKERERLFQHLTQLGVTVIPSQANFLFLNLGIDAARVAKTLIEKGIIVKPWKEEGYTEFLRVSIGTPQHNDRFAVELAKILDLS